MSDAPDSKSISADGQTLWMKLKNNDDGTLSETSHDPQAVELLTEIRDELLALNGKIDALTDDGRLRVKNLL